MKVGTFKLYEQGSLVSKIYRLNNYQIEENEGEILYAKLNWKSNSSVIIKGLEIVPNIIDTISFFMNHDEIEKNKYRIVSYPTDRRIEYKYEGILVRESSKIKKEYFDTLVQLNINKPSSSLPYE